jgi:hypothetical protein
MKRLATQELDDTAPSSLFIPSKRNFTPSAQYGCDELDAASTEEQAPPPVVVVSDIEYESLANSQELERKKENVVVTCYLAMSLYMHAKYVLAIALYWVSQFSNYNKRSELAWFTDHIERLLQYPATLALYSSSSLANHHSNRLQHTPLLRFAGSELHAVPNEYFLMLQNQLLIEAQLHLTQPENAAFMVYRQHGLKSELELDCFLYDRVLNYFYEPGFFILSSYYWYLRYLFHQSGGRDMSDFAPVLARIAAPLRQLPPEPGCLCRQNSNYGQKKGALLRDMAALHEILDQGQSAEQIEAQVERLWCEKAAQCDAVQGERFMHIYNQLYAAK